MSVMHVSRFTRDFLLLFSAPIIWVVHFLFVYGFTGIACARGFAHVQWFGTDTVAVAILGATFAAIVFIVLTLVRIPAGTDAFLRWSTIGLGLLSAVAVVWETLPVPLVPACG